MQAGGLGRVVFAGESQLCVAQRLCMKTVTVNVFFFYRRDLAAARCEQMDESCSLKCNVLLHLSVVQPY